MKEKVLNSKKKLISGISLACCILIINSCSSTNPAVNPDGTTAGSETKFAQEEVAGLKFSKVSTQNAALLANQQGGQNNSAQAPAPNGGGTSDNSLGKSISSVAPQVSRDASSGPTSAIAESSKMYAPYGGYFPAPGPFEEYVMIDYQEAKSEGYTGTYIDTYNKKVKAVIAAWSSDARHTSSNGSANEAGVNQPVGNVPEQNTPYYYSPYQWQYTFASASKKEVYSIFVSPKETLVLRQKWIIKDLSIADIKIDSNAAIKIYTDIISDKQAKSPDNQDQNINYGPNSEVLYSIPEKGSWYFYLNQEKEGLVWNININFNYDYDVVRPALPPLADIPPTDASGGSAPTVLPSFSPPQPVERTYYSGGYARINAKTGEVLSFNRPVKYVEKYYPYPGPYTKCDPNGGCYTEGSTGSAGSTTVVAVNAPDSEPSKQIVPQ